MTNKGMLLVVLATLVAGGGCKKNEGDGAARKEVEGSATSTEPTAEPTKPAPKTGAELAAVYVDCTGKISAGKLEEFAKDCVTDEVVMHGADGADKHGGAALVEGLKARRTVLPDFKLEPQLVLVTGRTVFAVALMTGTHDDKTVRELFFHKLALDDANKVTEEWLYGTARTAPDKGLEGAPIVVVAAADDKEKANVDLVRKRLDALNKADGSAAPSTDETIDVPTLFAAGDYVIAPGTLGGKKLPFADVMKVKDGKVTETLEFRAGVPTTAEARSVEVKPAEVKPAEVKPAEVKPAEDKAPTARVRSSE